MITNCIDEQKQIYQIEDGRTYRVFYREYEIDIFLCMTCKKKVSNEDRFREHICLDYTYSNDNGDNSFTCNICKYCSPTEYKLSLHDCAKHLALVKEIDEAREKSKKLGIKQNNRGEISYEEQVDMVMFKKILDNFDVLFESGKLGRFVDKNYKVIDNKDSIKTIVRKMYLNKLKTKDVQYRYVGKQTEGRLYSVIPSLQGISRVIRHSLARDIYYDCDMNNAHPVILRFYCEENNIPCNNLIYYIENRNECFKSLMDTFNISRDEAKRIPLTSINGGYIHEDNPQWMMNLHEELFNIRERICEINPQYVKRARENYEKKIKAREQTQKDPKYKSRKNPSLFENINGSACNYMLCKYENIILQVCIRKINEMGLKVGALVFDGFMVYKQDDIIIEDLLRILEEEILRETRIPMKLSVKEMDEGLDLSTFAVNNIPIDEFDGIVRLDDYVCPSIFSSSPITLVKAGLGRGKSTASITYINNNHFDKIFILTPRKTYAQSIVARFNRESKYHFELYSEMTEYNITNHTYVVIQCESLHRLDIYSVEGACVIIDEIESFLTQLTSVKTHKKNHLTNIRMFEFLCGATKLIGMDAFISEKSINLFRDMVLPIHYYNYIKPLEVRRFIEIQSCIKTVTSKTGKERKKTLYFEPFCEKILELIKSGKRMFLFISSIKKLEYLKNKLLISGINEEEISTYSSNCKDDLTNVNDLWSSKKVVFSTSSLTVGVNFDVANHFNSIGVYLSSTSRNLVRDIFQSLYRVRHITDKELYFTIDNNHYGIFEPIEKWMIKDNLIKKEDSILTQFHKYKIDTHNELLDKVKWLENLYIDNLYEYALSVMKTREEFIKYLHLCNYVEEDRNITSNGDDLNIINTDPVIFKYDDIPSITSNEMKVLRKLEHKTDMDNAKLEKFFFQQSIENISLDDEAVCWRLYNDCGKSKFRNISYEKGIRSNTLNLGDVISTTLPILAEKMSLKLEIIQDLTSWLGVTNTQDINTKINSETINKLVPLFKENLTKIYDAFEIKRSKGKEELNSTQIIRITNQVLDKWGFSSLERGERKQKRVDGKRVEVSEFKLQNKEGLDLYGKIRSKRAINTV